MSHRFDSLNYIKDDFESLAKHNAAIKARLDSLREEVDQLHMKLKMREDEIAELRAENNRLKGNVIRIPFEGPVK